MKAKAIKLSHSNRRIMAIFLGGLLVPAAVMGFVGWILLPDDYGLLAGSAGLTLIAFVFWLAVTVRIEILPEGIRVCRFMYRRFWPWEAFYTGRGARQGDDNQYQLYFPDLPLLRRTLTFCGIADRERDEIWELCWQQIEKSPATQQNAPTKIQFRAPWLESVIFQPSGVSLRRFRNVSHYAWEKVNVIAFKARNTTHSPLCQLEIHLPRRTIVVRACGARTRRGVLAIFLRQQVPPDRIRFFALEGPVENLEEIAIRDSRLRKKYEEVGTLKWAARLFFLLLAGAGLRTANALAINILAVFGAAVFGFAVPRAMKYEFERELGSLASEEARLESKAL